MKRLLLDVNVVLDVLLDREPFADDSSAVWSAIEQGDADGMLSAHAVTTLHYLNTKVVGPRMATGTTEGLLSVFEVAAVDEHVLRSAIALEWNDFEDAVTAAAAKRAKCDAVVTRNPRDFKGSPTRVLTPAEAIAWLQSSPLNATHRQRQDQADSSPRPSLVRLRAWGPDAADVREVPVVRAGSGTGAP